MANESAIEQVGNQVATLRARVAALSSQQAAVTQARADLQRAAAARKRGVISQEEVDQRREASAVAEAQAREAEQKVYQARAALGLPEHPSAGAPLDQVPADIAHTFSGSGPLWPSVDSAQLGLGVASVERDAEGVSRPLLPLPPRIYRSSSSGADR